MNKEFTWLEQACPFYGTVLFPRYGQYFSCINVQWLICFMALFYVVDMDNIYQALNMRLIVCFMTPIYFLDMDCIYQA